MQVRDIMTQSPAFCTLQTKLERVAQMMVEHDCGAIPVVDREASGVPVGIVTDRDITVRIVARGQNPLQLDAADAMTRATVTISPEADVAEAARMMKEEEVRRLLVVEATRGEIVGILAQADLARQDQDRRTGDVVEVISQPSQDASRPSPG